MSINHDKPTIQWDYDLPEIDCMEVWQSHWMAWNWVSLGRYQQRLASGLKISAIGGSDFHQPAQLMPEGPLVLARPTTVFWLEELSEDAVLAAMKAGRGYVTESPTGPHLALTVNGQPMGSTVSGPVIAEADVRVRMAICSSGSMRAAFSPRRPLKQMRGRAVSPARQRRFFVPKSLLRIAAKGLLPISWRHRRALASWQLQGVHMQDQPIRRAVSNPVYIQP